MEYTYIVQQDPPTVTIMKNDEVADVSGPWESVQAAETWAENIVNELNTSMSILE
jgi:hypothetical protein